MSADREPPQTADVFAFTLKALGEMHYQPDEYTMDTPLGPTGVDLGSLAVVELSYRVEDAYGARFNEEDLEGMAVMTLGEFAAEVVQRSKAAYS